MEFLKIADSNQLIVRIEISCSNCGKNFIFRGRQGFSTVEPTVSDALDEVRIPLDYPQCEEEGEEECKEEGEESPSFPPVLLN